MRNSGKDVRLGKKGEEIALDYLKRNGFRILERNYRTRYGEVDIIAEENGTLVFIEVKTRSNDLFGHPVEAVTKEKQERIKRLALFYLRNLKREMPVRFDVISINLESLPDIEHIRYAFE